jgi:hypothetical protein
MLGFRGKVRQVTSVIEVRFWGGGDLRHLELTLGTRYGRNGSPPQVLRRVLFYFAKKALKMSSGIGNWLIGVGALGACIGLIMLPAALGEHPDTNLLILGACCVSLGSLTAAAGIFFKARATQPATGTAAAESKNPNRRVRGGCDICHGDLPVIHCKVHQVHMCAECLGQHYDARTCSYVPSTRRTAAKPKNLAKARGA